MIRWRAPHFKDSVIAGSFLSGGLLALGCFVNYMEGNDLSGNAARASATVIAVHHGRVTTWDLTFSDVGGLPQRVDGVENLKGRPKVGDHVEVYYPLTDPIDSEEVTDVRFGPPGSRRFSMARRLGLAALVPLTVALYGAAMRTRQEETQTPSA